MTVYPCRGTLRVRMPGFTGTVPIGRPVLYPLPGMYGNESATLRKGQLNRQTQGTDQPLPHETQDRLALSPRSRRSGVGGLTHTHTGVGHRRGFSRIRPATLRKGQLNRHTRLVPTSHYHALPHETQERNKDAGARARPRATRLAKLTTHLFFCNKSLRSGRTTFYTQCTVHRLF